MDIRIRGYAEGQAGAALVFVDEERWVSSTGLRIQLWRGGARERVLEPGERTHQLRVVGRELWAAPVAFDLESGRRLPLAPLGARLADGLEPAEGLVRAARGADYAVGDAAVGADGERLLVWARRDWALGGGHEPLDAPRERLLLFGARTRELVGVLHEGEAPCDALAVGRRHVAAASRALGLWSLEGAAGPVLESGEATVCALAFDSAGERLAAVDAGGWLSLFRLDGRREARWRAAPVDARALAFHPARPLVATGGDRLRLWSLDGRLVSEADLGGVVEALALSPGGARAVAAVRAESARLALLDLG